MDKQDKQVQWTDLVGEKKTSAKGVIWDVRDTYFKNWSLLVNRKDNDSPYQLSFAYRVKKVWIPSPGNWIILASNGDDGKLNITVHEGANNEFS